VEFQTGDPLTQAPPKKSSLLLASGFVHPFVRMNHYLRMRIRNQMFENEDFLTLKRVLKICFVDLRVLNFILLSVVIFEVNT
jgi:hypothetical protein